MTTETSIYEYAKQGLKKNPDKTAIWFYGRSLSFRELFGRIDNVADNLYALGVRRGTVVTIHLPNCPQAVMAVYAVAKLGGISNMVHPLTPLKALQDNMTFTESSFLITGDHFSECGEVDFSGCIVYAEIAAHMGSIYRAARRLTIKDKRPESAVPFEELEKAAEKACAIPNQNIIARECAIYLNSSGTTGAPKTVMHSHVSCNNWVGNAKVFFQDRNLGEEVVMSVLPFFHGSGLIMNLHQVLCAGGSQVLLAKWNASEAAKIIRRYKITVLTGVPYLYQSLLEQRRFRGKAASRISLCFVSGDRTPIELKKAFDERTGHRVLFEGYGMTETVTACFSTSPYNSCIEASGYPLVNCKAVVMDETGQIHPHGSGELLLSTNTMMLGYLKDDEATSAAFTVVDGQSWFRTGDYGAIDEAGYIHFRERKKNIIIRNGYNIYPGEIETIIRKLKYVSDVAVTGRNALRAKGEDILAFIVLSGGMDQNAAKSLILKTCHEELPKYSIPNDVIFVPEIPRNRMSKVDKRKLESLL